MTFRATRRSYNIDKSGQRRHRPDYVLLVITAILLVFGLIVVYAISPGVAVQKNVSNNYYVTKQILAVVLGIVAFSIVSRIPLKWWAHIQKPLIVFAIIATLIALALPVDAEYPAHRWVRVGELSLQSVEIIKLAIVVSLAAFLANLKRNNQISDHNKTTKPLLLLIALLGIVVAFMQADLGSTGVLVAMVGAMSYVAGLPIKKVINIVVIIFIGLFIAISSSDYRRERVMTYLNPEADCQDAGYQACQALIAVGSGGLFGKGLSNGVQSYGYLPEASNDSIFAIIAEKFGFIGVLIILGLFAGLFSRIFKILERAPDDYSMLVVAGVLAWFSTQTLINIGSMIGLLPLKGITLPFISSGGTSIIFMLAALGIVFNISRYTSFGINSSSEGNSYENTANRWRDRRSYNATASRRT